MSTDVSQFFEELDAGVFNDKLSHILSQCAAAVIDHERQAEVTIKLKLSRIGSSHQVKIEHDLTYSRPTRRGKSSESDKTETPMHVGTNGRLSLFPENQGQLFDKSGAPATHKQ